MTIPFWTNLLVRNYAWILLLRDSGLINSSLQGLGLTSEPIRMLYTPFAVGVGLTYSFLPFMILPIYASLEKIDLRLVEAAYDLGASKWQALRRIVLPLAMPGIAAGSILVFIPSLGAYVTPELLGGSRQLMIGNLIQGQFGAARNPGVLELEHDRSLQHVDELHLAGVIVPAGRLEQHPGSDRPRVAGHLGSGNRRGGPAGERVGQPVRHRTGDGGLGLRGRRIKRQRRHQPCLHGAG